jgi:transposase-like protein
MIKTKKKYRNATNAEIESIVKMAKEGRTTKDIAERIGVAQSSVSNWRKKCGLLRRDLRKNIIEKYTISQPQEKPLAQKPVVQAKPEQELSQIDKIMWTATRLGEKLAMKSEVTPARARLVMDSLGQYGPLPDSDKIVQLTMSLSLRKEGKHYTLIDED